MVFDICYANNMVHPFYCCNDARVVTQGHMTMTAALGKYKKEQEVEEEEEVKEKEGMSNDVVELLK